MTNVLDVAICNKMQMISKSFNINKSLIRRLDSRKEPHSRHVESLVLIFTTQLWLKSEVSSHALMLFFQSLHNNQFQAGNLRLNNIHIGTDYLHLSERRESDDCNQSKPLCSSVSESVPLYRAYQNSTKSRKYGMKTVSNSVLELNPVPCGPVCQPATRSQMFLCSPSWEKQEFQ